MIFRLMAAWKAFKNPKYFIGGREARLEKLVLEIYEWTENKHTNWAKRAKNELMPNTVSRSMEPIFINRLTIHGYSITQQSDESYWIQHHSGEGLRTTPMKFRKLIHDFYCKEF